MFSQIIINFVSTFLGVLAAEGVVIAVWYATGKPATREDVRERLKRIAGRNTTAFVPEPTDEEAREFDEPEWTAFKKKAER